MNLAATHRTTLSALDLWISAADGLLKTLAGAHGSARPVPAPASADAPELSADERQLAGALMRVNHVGEVCAQALYTSQMLAAREPALRESLRQAARDEEDHLAWTQMRLRELGTHASWLNPLWYAGAFGIGWVAGRLGDRVSLGFVSETERQVEQHLENHLERLPANDHASRAIVEQMKADEARHAQEAEDAGGMPLPAPVQTAMRWAAKVMTSTAHHI
jgi:ubiquinone biosynthesis monooxygenase Coq7